MGWWSCPITKKICSTPSLAAPQSRRDCSRAADPEEICRGHRLPSHFSSVQRYINLFIYISVNIYTYAYIYLYIYICIAPPSLRDCSRAVDPEEICQGHRLQSRCLSALRYIFIYIHIYIYTHIYIYIYIYICT